MGRIEEFTQDGRDFVYLDMSGFKTNDEFARFIEESKPVIAKYAEGSLYTIANIESIKFDSETKKMVAEWTEHNKPYVKCGAVIGMTGVKKIMVNAVFALSGRKNMGSASSREKAIEWLLKQKL